MLGDRETAPGGVDVVRKCFWLNQDYVSESSVSTPNRLDERADPQSQVALPRLDHGPADRFEFERLRASRSRLSSNFRSQNAVFDFGRSDSSAGSGAR